ncbi:MAG: S41 family peptidase [Bacillus sp. (in: Bacteria)]|nr:S41 family peptidase [Bacillus sp. (in: firmicutes)]MCM1425222.1 S41 family peptidase [Eubacterium sp.]
MDNYGYSNNNEMNQGAADDLNPYRRMQQDSKQTKRTFLVGLLTGVLLSTLMTGCIYVGVRFNGLMRAGRVKLTSAEGAVAESIVNDDSITKLEAIEDVIDEYYYKEEDIHTDEMIEGMYAGMVASLGDPYSVYYTAEEWQTLMQDTEGIYFGIGAYISLDKTTGFGKINGVIDNTPAQEVGLREDDIIYMIDGEIAQGLELSEIVARIKGEEGTTVHLTIYRDGEDDYLEMDVVRKQIESPTVNYEMYDNGIGYIQITEFDDVTVDQFTEAMAVVKGSGAAGLILDLRSNPGGSLSAVVDIARQILPEGLIVYTEDRAGKRMEYTCSGENEWKLPLIVLVNGNSASASEILAGAIKDYGIGTLMGTKTFGKGIVQRILPLTDGTALKLTVSAYYTPKGNNIHNIGIEPDIECEYDRDAYYDEGIDNQLEQAKEEMKKMIAK